MSVCIDNELFADISIPDELQESMQRHRSNLVTLITSLRSAGLSEEQIDASVSVMVDSYKQELLRAIKAMVR